MFCKSFTHTITLWIIHSPVPYTSMFCFPNELYEIILRTGGEPGATVPTLCQGQFYEWFGLKGTFLKSNSIESFVSFVLIWVNKWEYCVYFISILFCKMNSITKSITFNVYPRPFSEINSFCKSEKTQLILLKDFYEVFCSFKSDVTAIPSFPFPHNSGADRPCSSSKFGTMLTWTRWLY